MKKALTIVSLAVANITAALAQTASTQGAINGGALLSLLALAQTIVTRLVPFAVGLAVVAFFWFLIGFIWKGRTDPKEQKASLAGMGWSVLALFVMVSIWGLVGFIGSMFGIGQGGNVPIPGVPIPGN